MPKPKPILIREDRRDGYIYVCPYCHRYVTWAKGLQQCWKCGGMVDNDHYQYAPKDMKVKSDGKPSWRE